eukprot:gb/GECG01015935.1/.p1 GENE.gb/GECG01015935.1/~~gb/GECG01015935.1/.p1  ORF type:complete len:956 (+),score=149.90 gb/GECG01015935.1/:1-2868(+)
MDQHHHHRSGSLKQQNKKHKALGKASVRRSSVAKGKVPGTGDSGADGTTSNAAHKRKLSILKSGKQRRINQQKQLRDEKRAEVIIRKRLLGGSSQGPPLVVGFYPLAENASVQELVTSIQSQADEVIQEQGYEGVAQPTTVNCSKFKTRFTLLECPSVRGVDDHNDTPPLLQALDTVNSVDILVLVMNISDGLDNSIDEYAHEFLSAVKASGTPCVVGAIQGVTTLKNSGKSGQKKANENKKHAVKFFENEFPKGRIKVADTDDIQTTLRTLTTVTPKTVSWRSTRPYVVANGVDYEATGELPVVPPDAAEGKDEDEKLTYRTNRTIAPNTISPPEATHIVKQYLKENDVSALQTGTIKLTGYVRGAPLSAEQYIYLNGLGYYPIKKISQLKHFNASTHGDDEPTPLNVHENKTFQEEELRTVAPEEVTNGEQTWPTEEEERAAEERMKRKPSGAEMNTDYTKAWLTDQDEIDEETRKEEQFKAMADEDADDLDDAMSDGGTSIMTSKKYGRKGGKREEEKEDLEFPDEVDTPTDIPARERFGRYRGLQSFRTSYWDPKESLPRSYSRIFQVQNYSVSSKRAVNEIKEAENALFKLEKDRLQGEQRERATERKAKKSRSGSTSGENDMEVETASVSTSAHTLSNADVDEGLQQKIGESWVPLGRYVMIEVPNVPMILVQRRNKNVPLVATGLLRHEHQTSVVHFNVQRVNTDKYDSPIKSKEELEFHCGFLRFKARPVFGENNLKSDKHKFERFLHANRWTVASAYGPILFGNMPIQVYKRFTDDANPERTRSLLVATGTLLGADPDRIVLKKIVLSGYPVKVNRRAAVVKFMFYSPEDILWFKPIELHTKHGLSGYIKEPVGTHGRMKCTFNGVIKQHDTVLMSLYKRVYPRWGESYRHLVSKDLMEASVGRSIPGGAGVNRGGNKGLVEEQPAPHPLDQFMAQEKNDGDVQLA